MKKISRNKGRGKTASPSKGKSLSFGGEGEIRTPGTFRCSSFRDKSPLTTLADFAGLQRKLKENKIPIFQAFETF